MTKDLENCEKDALAWVVRLVPGAATAEDLDAFRRWYRQSPAHAAAFANARKLSSALEAAARNVVAQEGFPPLSQDRLAASGVDRRMLLGGALAASAAAAVYVAARPPLGLWPSIAEFKADYRTATGEQKRVTLEQNVSFDLNTRTSLALRPASAEFERVELISGEGIVTAGSHPLEVTAGQGRTLARNAKFDIRRDGIVIVTCIEGRVQVECQGGAVTLGSHQQVSYSGAGIGQVVQADATSVVSWQNGFLVFHETPFAEVIAEINRYRRGRIIVLNDALGRRTVNGRFYLDRLDEVVGKIGGAFNAQVRAMPGGIVILS
jgi:transmembrane sensor